ncbi:hypothetical protein Tco_0505705 [Tanacetum coccineum]
MEIILDEEEVAIDAIPLTVKSPRIVDWKIHKEGKKSYYQIIRVDGKSQMYRIFSQMLKSFDREDLEDLYKLVKARYGSTRLVESMDYLLWNDMKIMFEPHIEDEVWKLQNRYKVLEWKLITAALIDVNAAQSKLLLLEEVITASGINAAKGVNAASEEVATAELINDDEDDGASLASTPSPTTYLNSLGPLDYQQYDIPTSSEQNDDLLFEHQTDLLNQTQQMHKELQGGLKSFGKELRGVFNKKKK